MIHGYRLAECLKELGFPQEPTIDLPNSLEEVRGGFYFVFPKEGGCGGLAFLNQIEYAESIKRGEWTTLKSPTFDDLRRELGDDFFSIERQIHHPVLDGEDHGGRRDTWVATGKLVATVSGNYESKGNLIEEADTPEEALGLLYITGKTDAKLCRTHYQIHQDICLECMNEERIAAGHPLE